MTGQSRFIGFGVGTYDDASLSPLGWAPRDVKSIRRVLPDSVLGDAHTDPAEEQARSFLKGLRNALDSPAALVLYWAGHGQRSPAGDDLMLFCADSENLPVEGISAEEIAAKCAASGASQILMVFDTCYSGAGANAAVKVASSVLDVMPPDGDRAWVGVLTSCQERETAVDGAFGKVLESLLTIGPRHPETLRRWSRHNREIRGNDLGEALLEQWGSAGQKPTFRSVGSPWWLLPNPLYEADAPAEVVAHLLQAARGEIDGERSWFTGRRHEVNQVVDWVTGEGPGLLVVTGSAGVGKSAIVGRVVSASVESERSRLDEQGVLGHDDPGVGSVHAHVHARGRTADQVAREIDAQLVAAGVLDQDAHEHRNAAQLVGTLQQRSEAGQNSPVIVIDGLDESRSEAPSIARDLITRARPFARFTVSTRDLATVGADSESQTPLLSLLNPTETLDLDAPEHRRSGRSAQHDYLLERLGSVDARMDPAQVANHLLDRYDDSDFLIVRVVADQLAKQPIATNWPGWEDEVPLTLGAALDTDLALVPPPGHRDLPDDWTPSRYARSLLKALTWGLGSGFPEEEWVVAACAVTGLNVGAHDITWVLEHLGRYVIEDGEFGVAVYRLAHQSVTDALREPFRPSADAVFDLRGVPVADALTNRYLGLLDQGRRPTDPGYLWHYAWAHAANAGPDAMEQFRELCAVVPDLRPDLARVLESISQAQSAWGRYGAALPPSEEAAILRRELATSSPALLPDLARALGNLGVQYAWVGRPQDALASTEEAVTLYRELAATNPAHLPDLAATLNNLGIHYAGIGRPQDAVAPTGEAVALRRELAATNPAHLPDLANVLNNLGNRFADIGRPQDAVAPTEDALALYRKLAATNPAHLPDLAATLNNLGNRYADIGRPQDAVALTEEAVALRRELAATNAAHLPNLANALTNLGNRYAGIGRPQDAVAPTEEAVTLYRKLAATNPAHLPNLARSLNNLGNHYAGIRRPQDAVAATEEAVALRRELVATNAAHLPNLANSLTNLGIHYAGVGRPQDAVAPTEEALALYRELAATNPAHLSNLANALTNVGVRYADIGRPQDAATPAEEAVALLRELAATNAGHLPSLASAVDNLGIHYARVGRPQDAVAPTEEAVTLYRELAATNPAHLPDLAGALSNVGNHYAGIGRPQDAVAPTEEALALYRELAATNPAHLPNLATALGNLGNHYARVGRPADEIDEIWDGVLAALPQPVRADLLIFRALAEHDPWATRVAWLAEAHRLVEGEPSARYGVRSVIRSRRSSDPSGFDAAWAEATGDSVPTWAMIDSDLVAAAERWVGAPTYDSEAEALAGAPELLGHDADPAVEDILEMVGPDEAGRLRDLRAAARAQGVGTAYRPTLLAVLATRFVTSGTEEQARLLGERQPDLLDPLVTGIVESNMVQDNPPADLIRGYALLLIATRADDLLPEVVAALAEPRRFRDMLPSVLPRTDAADLLHNLSACLSTIAEDEESVDLTLLFAVLGAFLAGDRQRVDAVLAAAKQRPSDWAGSRRDAWVGSIAQLISHRAELADLIQLILQAPTETKGDLE